MRTHYAWQFGKLSRAVGVLATNTGDARNRVWVASTYLFQVSPTSIPVECREDIEWIQRMLTRYSPDQHDDSALSATFRRTRNRTAGKIAERIWHVYHVYGAALRATGQA